MNKAPSKWALTALYKYCAGGGCMAEYAPGKWAPARPEGFFSLRNRLKCAWLVFTGRADALVWPEDDPAEEA